MNRTTIAFAAIAATCLGTYGCTWKVGGQNVFYNPQRHNVESYTHTIELQGLRGGASVQVDYETYEEDVVIPGKYRWGKQTVEKMLVRAYQGGKFKKGILLESYDNKASIKPFALEPGNLVSGADKKTISINAEFEKVKSFVQLRHEFEVSRCLSSKYWVFAKSFSPESRGHYSIQIGQVLTAKISKREVLLAVNPDGELVDYTVVPLVKNGLWDTPELTYVSHLPQSESELLYGKLSVATFALTPFELNCQIAYREILDLSEVFPDIWSGTFDAEVDMRASERLDELLDGKSQDRPPEDLFFNKSTLSDAILPVEFIDEKIQLLPTKFKTKFINSSKGQQSHD